MRHVLAVVIFCLSLIACTKPVLQTEYVKPTIPPLPPAGEYLPVVWKVVGDLYCTDAEGAKFFILNKKIQDSREKDLEAIIEGLR